MNAPHYSGDLADTASAPPSIVNHPPVMVSADAPASDLVERPEYVNLLPPCNLTCPAGENIQEWMHLVQLGRYEEAWRALVRNNPFPAIHGRVCYHPCENGCNRKRLEEPVSIHGVERYLGDLAIREGWWMPPGTPTGKRVLVIGSGPCGLSAAYHLALAGHLVTVYEAAAKLGGMLRYAIPAYRLPRTVLDAEIARLGKMGVVFQANTKIDNLDEFTRHHHFDAVFLSIGAQVSKPMIIPADDAAKILDALTFLATADEAGNLCAGRRVAVYGGGNTAMDAARTAKRLGAQQVLIIYRRDQARMPAHQAELKDALAEGVAVHWLRTIKRLNASSVQVEVMELDAKGQPQPTGKTESIDADMLILALGQETDGRFLKQVPGVCVKDSGEIEVDGHMMTGYAGIFAGGDMIPANKTVTTAVGHGKKAARNIDAYLHGRVYAAPAKHPPAKWDRLHVSHYDRSPRALQHEADVGQRIESFVEVVSGFDAATASAEAARCLSCGNCMECNHCQSICPGQAIEKRGAGKGYEIRQENCAACGLCASECPCGAISMVKKSAWS